MTWIYDQFKDSCDDETGRGRGHIIRSDDFEDPEKQPVCLDAQGDGDQKDNQGTGQSEEKWTFAGSVSSTVNLNRIKTGESLQINELSKADMSEVDYMGEMGQQYGSKWARKMMQKTSIFGLEPSTPWNNEKAEPIQDIERAAEMLRRTMETEQDRIDQLKNGSCGQEPCVTCEQMKTDYYQYDIRFYCKLIDCEKFEDHHKQHEYFQTLKQMHSNCPFLRVERVKKPKELKGVFSDFVNHRLEKLETEYGTVTIRDAWYVPNKRCARAVIEINESGFVSEKRKFEVEDFQMPNPGVYEKNLGLYKRNDNGQWLKQNTNGKWEKCEFNKAKPITANLD